MDPSAAEKQTGEKITPKTARAVCDFRRPCSGRVAWEQRPKLRMRRQQWSAAFNHEIFLEAIEYLKSAYEEDSSWVGQQKIA
jgi:hypothetical protein